jgi:hypothetical protein
MSAYPLGVIITDKTVKPYGTVAQELEEVWSGELTSVAMLSF